MFSARQCDGMRMQRHTLLTSQPQPPHLCPSFYTPSPARARSTSAAINRARACAFANSQSDSVRGRSELTATTMRMGWNSGVHSNQMLMPTTTAPAITRYTFGSARALSYFRLILLISVTSACKLCVALVASRPNSIS